MSADQVFAITDVGRTTVYGMLRADSAADALALAAAFPQEAMFGWSADAPTIEVAAIPHAELADGRWREMGPVGEQSHGDCGGDVQVSDSFSRRFVLARKTDPPTWAVLTHAWYAINASADEVHADTPGELIEKQSEYIICDDLRDLNYCLWDDLRYTKNTSYSPDEAGAKQAAGDFTVADIDWDGGSSDE